MFDVLVSRETRQRLEILAAELMRWQRAVNLVGPGTLDALWSRHIVDSLQLSDLSTEPIWVDLGSGGGFPGLVIAAADPSRDVTLIESDARKCAFLRHAAAAMGVGVQVMEGRIETVAATLPDKRRTVTARALASLTRLLQYGRPLWTAGSVGLFPKGGRYAAELTEARESWRFDVDLVPSRTDPDARILRVSNVTSR